MWALKSKRGRDYAGGMLMAAIGLAAAFQGSSYQLGTLERMGPGFFPTALGVILAAVGVAIAITARFTRYEGEIEVRAPEWRGWVCIIGALVAFVVLGKYGGLLPGDLRHRVHLGAGRPAEHIPGGAWCWALATVVVAIVVFWWALQLQFPLFQWGAG